MARVFGLLESLSEDRSIVLVDVRRDRHPFVAVASFEERIYQLGLEALAKQERQVAEARSRGSTLLAAGAVIASLLAKGVFHGVHPDGVP